MHLTLSKEWEAVARCGLGSAESCSGGQRRLHGVSLRGYDRYFKRNSRKEEEAPPFHLISKGGQLPGIFRWVVRWGAAFTAKEEGEGS